MHTKVCIYFSVPSSDSDCKTLPNSSVSNAKCVFPFVYQGVTYNKCPPENDYFWCSTKTDSNNKHQTGNWGKCNENCPTLENGKFRKIGKVGYKHELLIFLLALQWVSIPSGLYWCLLIKIYFPTLDTNRNQLKNLLQ